MKDYVEFFNGQKMPLLGLGTWQAENPKDLETAMNEALAAGYRHFDTAYLYQNEKILGKIFKEWISSGKVKREELFITTKLPICGMDESRVEHFLNLSLTALELDYVDLYLIHTPLGAKYVDDKTLFPTNADGVLDYDMTTNILKIWAAMEKQVEAGRTKSIGLSNFWPCQIERIMEVAKIQPANLQSEAHIYYQQKAVRDTCKKYGITFCAYAPFGSPGRKGTYEKRGMKFTDPGILDDPVVKEVGINHGKSAAQVLLRFLVQQGIVVIPKSINPIRVRDNAKIFDFELTQDDMKKLEALDKGSAGRSFTGFPGSEKHPEYRTC
jgi:alcohol dehydrogenase (NADP+)